MVSLLIKILLCFAILTFSAWANSWHDREEGFGSENLAIDNEDDTNALAKRTEPPISLLGENLVAEPPVRPSPSPIRVPCHILVAGMTLPFEECKNKIVNLLRDISSGSSNKALAKPEVNKQFVCPPSAMSEIRRLIELVSSPLPLEESGQALRAMAMAPHGFDRLGQDCAVDVLVLSDALHHWGSELHSLSAAVEHAKEDCMQAWAHFLAFIDRSESLMAPTVRSEKCIFVDEYRKCFDP